MATHLFRKEEGREWEDLGEDPTGLEDLGALSQEEIAGTVEELASVRSGEMKVKFEVREVPDVVSRKPELETRE